ncbi:hypothetical protein [Aquimarina macrocephali]|uniref:hypothetical protein n=1 Tax=Aquimarina macrocephali TaxID=666563 RepID=UPI003F668CD2
MKTTANKITAISVEPHPVLTQESLAELFINGTIEIDSQERTVFAEVESSGFHILCERLELDTDYQDITFFYDDLEITNETSITEIANFLYNYAIKGTSSDSGFTHQDKQHASSLIYK